MRTIRLLACVLLGAFAMAGAAAFTGDDTVDEALTGGLVIGQSRGIDMVSEDLFISADQIRVRYVFRNRTARPIRTSISIPVPDFDQAADGVTARPSGFATRVDGQPVRMSVTHRALVRGTDRSAMLRRLHIPIGTPTDDMYEAGGLAIGRLPRSQQDWLVDLGIAHQSGYFDGTNEHRLFSPAWTVRETWQWQQSFPVGRDVAIELRYRPATGGYPATSLYRPEYRRNFGRTAMNRHCIDQAFVDALDRIVERLDSDNPLIPEQWISYNLTSGGNWRAPIGDFRLVVDKGRPDNIVSFCGEGVRRISPTRFEVRHRNWTPNRDLNILILGPGRARSY